MEQAIADQTAAFQTVSDNIDTQVRKIDAKAYHCALGCCEREHLKSMDRQKCVQQCMVPTQQAQHFIESEVQRFNDALTRAVRNCEDQFKNAASMLGGVAKLTPEQEDKTVNRLRNDYEKCVTTSVQKQTKALPELQERIMINLKF